MNQNSSSSIGQIREASFLERDLAQKALDKGDFELAWQYDKKALTRLSSRTRDSDCDDLLVSITLEFSNLCFALGKGFKDSAPYLKKAETASERLGDRRSRALIFMHLGRFYYFAQKRHDALALFGRELRSGVEEERGFFDDGTRDEGDIFLEYEFISHAIRHPEQVDGNIWTEAIQILIDNPGLLEQLDAHLKDMEREYSSERLLDLLTFCSSNNINILGEESSLRMQPYED